MENVYFFVGFLIAGAHFAWAYPRTPEKDFFDVMPPVYRLGALCVFLIGPCWPIYMTMLLGAILFTFFTATPSDDVK